MRERVSGTTQRRERREAGTLYGGQRGAPSVLSRRQRREEWRAQRGSVRIVGRAMGAARLEASQRWRAGWELHVQQGERLYSERMTAQ
jgi:hypothetical protein